MDTKPNIPLRYCLYARKSTESEEKQVLSIDSQIREMEEIAKRKGLNIVCIKRESYSAKSSGKRVVFKEIIDEVDKEIYNGILTWAPDRLSRNAGDLGSLVDLMDVGKLIDIQTYGQTFSNSPNEKFLLMILCSQAKLENDNKGVNVKRGLRARCDQGLWPFRPPTGYLKSDHKDEGCVCVIDELRSPVIKQMFEKIANDRWSGRKLHDWLRNEIHFTHTSGKSLSLGNVYRVLQNHFYYGKFEYPVHSGNWFDGVHEPIISKELFDAVQEQMNRQSLVKRSDPKEFAFTKLMTCGLCGSGVTADEKFKELKGGGVNRHVYYRCSRSRNQNCNYIAINEQTLIKQIAKIIKEVGIKNLPMKEKIRSEVDRIKKFYSMILNEEAQVYLKDVHSIAYATFILQEGSLEEQRDIMNCLKGQLVLQDKKISLI
jgi:DNA invertase Pin-like site-specific DNA recombinase